MKIGLLGVGYQGQKYIRTFQRLNRRLEWTSNKPRFDADAIIIATPAESHFEIAKEALSRGKHVIIEKPMVMDVKEAQELYDLSVEKNVTGLVNHVHLYSPAWREIKRKAKDVVSFVSCSGGPCKTDPKWDWGSHDVAMKLDITTEDRPHEIYITEGYTPRRFIIHCKDEVLVYSDPETNPLPMDILIEEFIKACEGNTDQSGIKMGLEVAKVLCG